MTDVATRRSTTNPFTNERAYGADAVVWSVATRPDLYVVAFPERDALVQLLEPVGSVLSTFAGVNVKVMVSPEGNIVAIPVGRSLAWLECKRLRD